jgi:DNA-binding NtrC family response regulator
VFTDTVPNGAFHPRSIHTSGSALYLAHAEHELRGHERWIIPQGGLVLGRELVGGDYQLRDARLSRRHATVEPDGQGGYQVRDLGSRNGTGVNGHRLEATHHLAHGDVLRLGDTLVVFAARAVPLAASAAAAPPGASCLLGHSIGIGGVRLAIEQLAQAPVHVLIVGESGVGKETIARALHARAPRGPLVHIVLSGVAQATLEGQLNAAWAAGGTIFLDGVTELTHALQTQLASALAGPDATRVRVIASTTRDLGAEARAGRFHADLHALLAAHTIHVPPLRERREDLPLLVADVLARLGAPGRGVDADLAQAMLLAAWPLNLRGLANVVETALGEATAGQPLALVEQVAQMFAVGDAMTATVAPQPPGAETSGSPSIARGRTPIADELREALRQSRGNVAEAARQFGCSRQQIYRWMRAVGVELDEFRPSGASR